MKLFQYKKMKQAWEGHEKAIASGSHPERDWFISLCIFTLINLYVLVWSILFFSTVNSATLFSVNPPSFLKGEILDQQRMNTLLSHLSQKSATFNAIQNNPPPSIDPSF
jgi:hypothetical protein